MDLNDEDLEEGLFPPESLEPELGRILRELDRKLEGLEPDSSSLLQPCLEEKEVSSLGEGPAVETLHGAVGKAGLVHLGGLPPDRQHHQDVS